MEAGIALDRLAGRRRRDGDLALVGLDRRRRRGRVRRRDEEPPSAARARDPVLDAGRSEDEGELAELALRPRRADGVELAHRLTARPGRLARTRCGRESRRPPTWDSRSTRPRPGSPPRRPPRHSSWRRPSTGTSCASRSAAGAPDGPTQAESTGCLRRRRTGRSRRGRRRSTLLSAWFTSFYAGARRWRPIAHATATFREWSPGAIGIETHTSASARADVLRPSASEPRRIASGFPRGRAWQNTSSGTSPSGVSATTVKPCARRRASPEGQAERVTNGTRSTPPIETRTDLR